MLHCWWSSSMTNIYKWLSVRSHIYVLRIHMCVCVCLLCLMKRREANCAQRKREPKKTVFCWIIRLFCSGIFHIAIFPFELFSRTRHFSVVVSLSFSLSLDGLFFPSSSHFFFRKIECCHTFLHQIMKSYYEWLCDESNAAKWRWKRGKIHNDIQRIKSQVNMSRASDKNAYHCRE